jgi:cell division protein FtsL
MKNNRKIEEPEINDETIEKKTDKVERHKEVKKSSIAAVLEGDILVKEGFVKLFPFLMYVVFLLMLCIANTYIAEDVNREIAKLNKMEESLHVEYVYYKSEITKSTTQSNLVKKLAKKGIKESVVPLRKIVAEKEGGER